MPENTDTHIGTRIREIRAIRAYSLAELGRRAHVSTSQLSRIENGDQPASASVLASVARALAVTLSVLHGQPYVHMLQKDQLDRMLAPISSALDAWDIPPEGGLRPLSLDDLAARTEAVTRQRAAGEFGDAAEALPELIEATGWAVQEHSSPSSARERAHNLQAEVARTTAIIAYRLGYMDLARLALSRMAVAAPQSGDPRQVAVERYERAVITHAESSRPDRGVALMRRALQDLDDNGDPTTRAVRGTLLLRASALSAVQRDHSAAAEYLGQAKDVAEAGAVADAAEDPPGTRYALAFGKANVDLGRLDVAMYKDDHEEALRTASQVRLPDSCQPTRVAGFLIRKASAEAWTAHHDDALLSLERAREKAPQLTRYHPEVHVTVGTLLRARQRAGDPLQQFAQWSGV